jgi:tetratricopeptide (TPR) repeat protein
MSNPYPSPYDARQRRGSPKAAHRDYAAIGVIFCVAFLLRIAYWLVMKHNYFFYDHPSSDVLYYQEWAREISRINWIGTKTFFGLPLYPYFLAVVDRLSLGNAAWVRLTHLFLGSVNCVLTYAVAVRIFSRRVAFLSGLLLAANFVMIYYDWLMMPVTLITSLSLVIILSFSDFDKLAKKRECFLLGFLIGLAALGDGKLLIFLSLTLIYILYRYREELTGKFLGIFLMLLIGAMLPLGLTGLRNKIVGGDWIWISAQRGLSFYVGNNSKATGIFDNPCFIRPTHQGQDEDQVMVAEILAKRPLTPAGVSRFWQGQALSFIKNQPLDYLRLLGKKFKLFFTETEEAYDLDLLLQREWKGLWDINPFSVMCPLAMIGMAAAWGNRRQTIYLDFMILSQLVFTVVFFLTHRHRAAIFPFLIIYESFCVLWLADHLRLKNFKRLSLALGFFVLFLFVFMPQTMAAGDVAFYHWTKSGAVYEKRQDLPKARECYANALTLRPADTNAMYNLANAYALDGDFASAKEHYQKILALNPYQVDTLYNLGFVEEKMGAYEESLVSYLNVLQLQPQSPDALLQIAQVYQSLGDCDLAREYYTQLMRLKPQFAGELHERMAQCP